MQEYEQPVEGGASDRADDSGQTEPERRPEMAQQPAAPAYGAPEPEPPPAPEPEQPSIGCDEHGKGKYHRPKEGPSRNRLLRGLKAEVRELQRDPSGTQPQIDNNKKKVAALEAHIGALEKADQNIETTVDSFNDAYDDLKAAAEDLEDYADRKCKGVAAAIGDVKEDDGTEDGHVRNGAEWIAEKRTEANEEIRGDRKQKEGLEWKGRLEREVPDPDPAADSVLAAEFEYENAKRVLDEKRQKDFDYLAGEQKRLEDGIKAANDLRKELEEEEDKGELENLFKAYVLALDLKNKLRSEYTDPAENEKGILDKLGDYENNGFRDALDAAWKDLYCAMQDLRAAQHTLNEKNSTLATVTANLKEAEENRVDRILDPILSNIIENSD